MPAALLGFLLHAPLYFGAKSWVGKKFDNDHFDSVLATLLFAAYPFYLLLLFFLSMLFTALLPALSVFILVPFTAWATVQLKDQTYS